MNDDDDRPTDGQLDRQADGWTLGVSVAVRWHSTHLGGRPRN